MTLPASVHTGWTVADQHPQDLSGSVPGRGPFIGATAGRNPRRPFAVRQSVRPPSARPSVCRPPMPRAVQYRWPRSSPEARSVVGRVVPGRVRGPQPPGWRNVLPAQSAPIPGGCRAGGTGTVPPAAHLCRGSSRCPAVLRPPHLSIRPPAGHRLFGPATPLRIDRGFSSAAHPPPTQRAAPVFPVALTIRTRRPATPGQTSPSTPTDVKCPASNDDPPERNNAQAPQNRDQTPNPRRNRQSWFCIIIIKFIVVWSRACSADYVAHQHPGRGRPHAASSGQGRTDRRCDRAANL
jgi:hypothetical protein